MPRKLRAFALLLSLVATALPLWSMGQKADIFIPVDELVAEKRYAEAIDMLRGLEASSPSKAGQIKDRIADIELLQADAEIEAQRYNEALAFLSLFWAQNPEKADEAQRRIRTINKVREDYNKKAKSLLAYMSDPKNREDTNYNIEVTKRLEDLDVLDRNNPDSKKTITSLKETSLALVNQDSMKSVMRSGRALIDKGEYSKAAAEYAKGLSLFKAEFENAGYDDFTVQAVAKEASKIASFPAIYEGEQADLQKYLSELRTAFESGQPERTEAALTLSLQSLNDLTTLHEGLLANGTNITKMFAQLPKEGKSPIEYQYLAYLDIFAQGRPDSFGEDKKPAEERGLPEGMDGALLAQRESFLVQLGSAIEASIDAAYAAAEKAYDEGRYEEARSGFGRTAALVPAGAAILDRWSLIKAGDYLPELASLKTSVDRGLAAEARIRQLASVASAGARLAPLSGDIVAARSASAAYVASLAPTAALQDARIALVGYRNKLRGTEAALAKESAGREALTKEAAEAAAKLGDERPTAAATAYFGRLDKAASAATTAEYATAAQRGSVEADYIARELASREASVAAADAMTDGAASTRPERARAGYRDPSPSSSSVSLEAEAAKIAALRSWTADDLKSMAAEPAALLSFEAFASAKGRIEDLAKQAADLEAKRSAAYARALEQKKAAAALMADAKTSMDNARARLSDAKALVAQDKKGTRATAIKKGFADSRTQLEKSLSAILESANSDFVAKTWDDFQDLYAKVSADIDQSKKDYVINETFRLLSEGQTYYEQALFDLSAESLNNAQELWREDNDADQEQVKYWQNLVRQASDTNNKREVRPSDALYYEIGNYLSEARKAYLNGDALMKAGKKADATTAFDQARQNISFVTRAFPLNAEAGLLTLQILKSTDADAYKKSLPRRIQEASDLLAADPSAGYSRIADLYKMEPGYPGLKAILEKAEIKVGKRRAPPSKEDLASAASFVASAEKLLQTGRKDDAAKAESALNTALTYDPSNKRALDLLRDLKTLQGKTSGPTLGLADQAVLDQATRAFASQQYNQARDGLSALLSDPGKRTKEVLKLDNDLKTLGY